MKIDIRRTSNDSHRVPIENEESSERTADQPFVRSRMAGSNRDEASSVTTFKCHEVFSTLPMPDLGCEIEDSIRITWTINNWVNRPPEASSPLFRCSRASWQMALSTTKEEMMWLSLRLIIPPPSPEDDEDWWPVYTQHLFLISNVEDPCAYRSFYQQVRFNNNEERQKQTESFVLLRHDTPSDPLRFKSTGHTQIVYKDSVNVSIWLRVLRKKSFEEKLNRISRMLKAPPQKGLVKTKSRRYLNAYIQFINSVPYLRRWIFRLPVQFITKIRNPSRALKRVLSELQSSATKPIDPTDVITTFPWDTIIPPINTHGRRLKAFCGAFDTCISSLMEESESKETLFEDLFMCSTKTTLRQEIDYTSIRFDQVPVLTVTLKYNHNTTLIPCSLIDYLQGDESADPRISTTFISLPPILRIAFEVERDKNQRLPHPLNYPQTLNLNGLVDASSGISSTQWIYHLHAIFVLGSDEEGDYYFTLLRPLPSMIRNGEEEIWIKFQDEQVTKHHVR